MGSSAGCRRLPLGSSTGCTSVPVTPGGTKSGSAPVSLLRAFTSSLRPVRSDHFGDSYDRHHSGPIMLALGNQAKVNAPQNLRPNFDLATNLALADHSYAQVICPGLWSVGWRGGGV